jgi:hypothetical protein
VVERKKEVFFLEERRKRNKMKDKTYVVYLHVKKDTKDVFYVGIGSKRRAYSTNKRNSIWNNYYNKYGRDVIIVNKGLSYEDAIAIESELIHTFGRLKFEEGGVLTNRVIKVGYHFEGKNHTESTKEQMSVSARYRSSHNKEVSWYGKTYISARECSRKEGKPFSTVQKYLNWDNKPECYYKNKASTSQ